ncbi:MAG: diaminopimelate epimerase [Actinomycetota bacterium]|jgi:diaminopimelate epimerase
MHVVLSKHQALGNDFLVLDLDQDPSLAGRDDWADVAVRLCDRRFGVGADGLLLLRTSDVGRLHMILHNSDGGRAEMSGNGIRCLVQAAHHGVGGDDGAEYEVHTDAGVKTVIVEGWSDDETVQVVVDMGAVDQIDEPADWATLECHPDRPVSHLSLGNPHAVVGVDDVAVVDLEALGAKVPHVNLEIVEPGPESHAITMRVHERGAGITLACGTGACASAAAALSWGLVPATTPEVLVHMPGGDARVRFDHESRVATLVGPATFVASITVHL